jgi:hypothetical protein
MRGIVNSRWQTLAVIVTLTGIGFSQTDKPIGTLIVSGHAGQVPVTHMNGQSYVAVEALARLINGSLGYQGSQITLTLPTGGTERAIPPSSRLPNSAFSKDFLKAGIETMSDIREWRSALLNAVENGYPVAEAWIAQYRTQAARNLRLTSVATTTNSDHNAFNLLSREFDHMQELSNRILTMRKNLSYIDRGILKNDPLDQKILNCARSLAAMAASDEFQDDGSCH